jgi:cytochrome c oxidase subunit 2
VCVVGARLVKEAHLGVIQVLVGVDKRHEYGTLEGVYLPIAAAVFAIVCLFVAYAGVRGALRRRRGEAASQRSEHNPLEIGYAALLTLIVALLVYLTFTTEDKTDAVARRPGVRVIATAGQWSWRFSYPVYGKTVEQLPNRPAEIVVPTGTEVNFVGTSQDVVHAFYVPERRFKRDLFPGRNQVFTLVWPRPVRDLGECAEFCGLLHAHMEFYVRAVPPAAFEAWARSRP